MAAPNFWCVYPGNPLVSKVAKKYNLTEKDAQIIITNARKDNAALQADDIQFEFLETQESFKNALEVYNAEFVDTDKALLQDVREDKRTISELKDTVKEEYGYELSDEEAQELAERQNDIPKSIRLSQKNAQRIAKLLHEFPDTRRMEFLGDWLCRSLSEFITKVQNDPALRKKYKIKKQKNRIDYFTDIDAMNAFRATILGDEQLSDEEGALERLANDLQEKGQMQLAKELDAVADNLNTFFFMYGGKIFRDEGIEVGPDGLFTKTEYGPESQERNETDTQTEDDEDTDGEKPITTFSASDQNKSILSKMVPDIKVLLNTMHEKTGRGQDKTDSYGYGLWTYVSTPQAVNKLLRLCKGCETFSDMMKVLQANKRNTPWLQQLIAALDTNDQMDITGKTRMPKSKKEQLQTMFFQSFRKQFTRFRHKYQTTDIYGNVIFTDVDSNLKDQSVKLMNKVRRKFSKMKGMDIMRGGKVSPVALAALDQKLGTGRKRNDLGTLGRDLALAKNKANKDEVEATKMLDKLQEDISETLAQMGIEASSAMLSDYSSNDPHGRQYKNVIDTGNPEADQLFATRYLRLGDLLKMMKRLKENLQEWANNEKSDLSESPFSRKSEDKDGVYPIRTSYRTIIANLTEFSADTFESMSHVNGKDYYSWNNPSSILTIVENLATGGREKIREYIKERYCRDSLWYLMPQEETGLYDEKVAGRFNKEQGPAFYSDLLEGLYYGNESEEIDYSEILQFAGETYNEMSDASYAMCMLNDYFTIQDFGLPSAKKHTWYRMLIAGDKPRYATVRLPRYAERNTLHPEKDYHNIISRKAIDFFAQEIRRSESVFRYAATHPDGLRIENYDVDPKKFKEIFNKRKMGRAITVQDVVKDGRYIFRNTGLSFFQNKFINDEIENNTALGQYVVDRVFNTHMYKDARPAVAPDIMDEFRKGFAAYMQTMRDQLMQTFQDIGLFEENVVKDEEGNSSVHLKYLIGNMRQWNADNPNYNKFLLSTTKRENDLAAEDGIDLMAKENARYRTYYREKAQFAGELEEFVYNNWLAKVNMAQLFDVDLAFYGDTTNFQKRNAQVVSSGHTTDPEAKIHNEPVSDGKYRSITLATPFEFSQHMDNIRHLLQRRLDQITDPLQKHQFELGMKDTLKKLEEMDTTDGQSYVGLTGLRKHRAGQGEWSRSDNEQDDELGYIEDEKGNREYVYTDEAVYRRIKRRYIDKDGNLEPETVKINDMQHVFAQVQKDFVYTIDHFAREGRGTISVPVQHKNSEYMLSFLSAFTNLENPGSQMEAIARFLEETAEDDPKAGIDSVHFDSVVKIGGNNKTIDLKGKSGREALTILRDAVYKDQKNKNKNNYRPGVVTQYDSKDYKIVQEKPEHYKKTQQPTGTQFKILAINNIPDTTVITLPNGKTMTAKEMKKRYFALQKQKTRSYETDLRKAMGLRRPASQRLYKLSNFIKEAMSTDRKFSVDTRRSLSVVDREGTTRFVTPLDEPGVQGAVESLLISKTRKTFYKQKSNGGIIVQATSWGESEDLHIRFFSSDEIDIKKNKGILCATLDEYRKVHGNKSATEAEFKAYQAKSQQGYAHFEFEAAMPAYVRKMIANRDGSIDSKYFLPDGNWDMEELRKALPDSVFDAICYRVPTEAKYSIMACRLVRFSKEGSGSVAKYPKELTTFTGADFDIDTDTVELRPEPAQAKNKDIDNELFDIELAALRSDPAIGETFKSGDFSDLSEASYYFTLLETGRYTREQLDKLKTKELKNLCKQVEDRDVMNPVTDIVLHNQNSDASSMIGIAAVGVTSHAFLSLYNDVDTDNPERDPSVHPENFVRILMEESRATSKGETISQAFTVINDKDARYKTQKYIGGDVLLDMMYDMDGKLIGTEISKYVGASADAAKDAALYRLGLNQRTLPIAVLMHRMGISSDVVRAFMKQPIIKDLLLKLNAPSYEGRKSISDACAELRGEIFDSVYADLDYKSKKKAIKETMDEVVRNNNIILAYSELVDHIVNPESVSLNDALELLHIFETLASKADKLRNLDGFTRYNSPRAMKGSSFFDRYVSRNRLQKLNDTLTANDSSLFKLPQDVKVSPEYPASEFGRLCSMYPQIAETIMGEDEILDDLIVDNMKTYNTAFFDLIDRFNVGENTEDMRTLYAGWKNYLLFVSDKRIADFRNDKATAENLTRNFALVYEQELEELKKDPETKKFIEDNDFINSIEPKPAKDGYGDFEILSADSLHKAGAELEAYQRDWEALVKNPKTRDLAINLSTYFLARSAAFARDTPVTLMPYEVKKAIPGYLDAFREADLINFDEDEMDKFIIDFLRNNISDRAFVPHIRYKENRNYYDKEKQQLVLDPGSTISKYVYYTSDDQDHTHTMLRSPIIVIRDNDGEHYLMAASDELITQKVGKKSLYIIPVAETSPLGIPYQLSEYTGKPFYEKSMYLDEDQEAPAPEMLEEESGQMTPEVTDSMVEEYIVENEDIDRGQIVGTYLDSAPFGAFDVDGDTDYMMAREPIDYKNNPFLESRTHLKRAGKLARAMGVNLRSTQRGLNTEGKPTYFFTISHDNLESPHDAATIYGSLLGSLGKEKEGVHVTTYVRNISQANAMVFTMRVNLSEDTIRTILRDPELTAEYNADKKELSFISYFREEDMGEKLAQLRDEIQDMKKEKKMYGIKGDITVNFARMDYIRPEQQKEILKSISNGTEQENTGRVNRGEGSEDTGERGNQKRRQVGVSDIAAVGLDNLNGKNVQDEIRNLFGESYRPLSGANTSYSSRALSDEVQKREDANESLRSLGVDNITMSNAERIRAVDNLIINAANWIIGNRPQDMLEDMFGELGFQEEDTQSIIATIKQVIKEQNIC